MHEAHDPYPSVRLQFCILAMGQGRVVLGMKRYLPEGVVNKPREADVLIAQGQTVAKSCKHIGEGHHINWLQTKRLWMIEFDADH